MKLMVVESPNKVKKIAAILGDGWEVMASAGHVRDLPKNDLGIEEHGFHLKYEFVPRQPIPGQPGKFFPGGEDRVGRIAKAAKEAEMVYLATDPDREGEAIAWHLKDAMRLPDARYQRVTFDAITPDVIRAAIGRARKIDANLVYAQEARRALDRLVGYIVSPLLWDQLGATVSAGRVQSPAVRLVVEREREIKAFKETKHFGAAVYFDGDTWAAEWNTKPFLKGEAQYILDEALAHRAAECRAFKVIESDTATAKEAPPSPFSTSLLLQAASVSLKFDPEFTAKVAQKLFEQGLITYHRTDSVNFSGEAIAEIRTFAQGKGWKLPEQPRRFKVKGDAQEAHEAIRPTHLEDEEAGEDEAQRALYKLIWKRAIASQLADALYRVNTVVLESTDSAEVFEFRAKGRVLTDPGWRALTAGDAAEDADAEGKEDDGAGGKVPRLEVGSAKRADTGKVLYKKTKPPARYTKASLIKKLEACGIGRPSTYPAIMANIMGKGYLVEEKRFLVPTALGADLVDALVKGQFGFIELPFTKDMEEDLDRIAEGQRSYVAVVGDNYEQLREEIARLAGAGTFKPRFPCPECGKALRRVKGPTGYFWGCTGYRDGCKVSMDDDKGQPVPRANHPCPDCGKPLRRVKGKNGFFWSCSGYKDGCTKTMDDKGGKPVERKLFPCPSCGRDMRRIKGPKGYFWGCSGYKEGCETTLPDDKGKPGKRIAKNA